MDALAEARQYLGQYQRRINQDTFYGDTDERQRYEDAAYKEGMLAASIAQAEQLKRIADALYGTGGFSKGNGITDTIDAFIPR